MTKVNMLENKNQKAEASRLELTLAMAFLACLVAMIVIPVFGI